MENKTNKPINLISPTIFLWLGLCLILLNFLDFFPYFINQNGISETDSVNEGTKLAIRLFCTCDLKIFFCLIVLLTFFLRRKIKNKMMFGLVAFLLVELFLNFYQYFGISDKDAYQLTVNKNLFVWFSKYFSVKSVLINGGTLFLISVSYFIKKPFFLFFFKDLKLWQQIIFWVFGFIFLAQIYMGYVLQNFNFGLLFSR